jgi:hypothetical protein
MQGQEGVFELYGSRGLCAAASPGQVFELFDGTVHSTFTMTNNSNAMDIFHPTDHMSVVQTAGYKVLQHLDKRLFDVTSFSVQTWSRDFTAQSCKQDHILSHCCLIDKIITFTDDRGKPVIRKFKN